LGDVPHVYEVELDDPEIDTNVHRPWDGGPYHSVMAQSGRVIRRVLPRA
jgi:hypothetical protein